jgi:AcrR family transcriptional regulator
MARESTPESNRTVRKRDLSRAIIIKAAAELADKTCSGDVTLQGLAKALGVKMPSLYNHVNGQQDLRQSLAVHALECLRATLVSACVGRSSEDAIAAMCGAYRTFAHRHPGIYRAILRVPEPNEKELRAANGAILQLLLQVLSPFRLPEESAIHSVRALRALLHGFVSLEMVGAFRKSPERDESYHRMVGAFLSSLRRQARDWQDRHSLSS